MQLYCGIDLHSNNCLISLINEEEELVSEKRVANDLDLICRFLEPHQASIDGVVVESTYNWYWLVDGLINKGYPLHLANTLAIQQYKGIKYTNDASDARYLAHLLRLKILPTGFIYPKETRHLRDVLRRRLLLVKQHTALLVSLQNMINRHSGKRLSSAQIKQLNELALREFFSEAGDIFAAEHNVLLQAQIEEQIKQIEEFVLVYCKQCKQFSLLQTVPGIGKILAMTILLETGPIERFSRAGCYASYARCVPSDKVSNGKSKGQGNTKNGNRYLSLAFMEAAHYASIWSPEIKRFYQRKCKKVHIMVAKKTIANKLARACYHMLTNNTPFDVARAFS